MVIMSEHHFTLNRRGLLGTALATSAALTFGGSPYAMAAPIRQPAHRAEDPGRRRAGPGASHTS